MTPIAFAGTFGRFHAPRGTPSGVGLVVVPAHGLEALAAAHSFARIAHHLAGLGHAVVRFDLPGTADSLGSEADPDRLGAWTEATVAAAAVLAAAGVDRIVLAGHRFGAHIAMAAAPHIAGFAGLALLDPVVRGRAYSRELVLTARAVAEGARLDPDATSDDTGVQVGGHLTSAATLAAMKGLDLSRLAPPAVPTLVLHRREAPEAAALRAAWAGATFSQVAGFEGLGLSPTMAETPLAVAEALEDWLDTFRTSTGSAVLAPAGPAVLTAETFTEEAVVFGPDNRLFGILCRPVRPKAGAAAMLIVNAGRTPHVGWARSAVNQARSLAEAGHASLRFDLGGIGDSRDYPGAADSIEDVLYAPGTIADAKAGLDWLAAASGAPVVAYGACAGAFVALRLAADPRVPAVILVNLQRFVWRPGETVAAAIAGAYPLARSYVAKAKDPRAWAKALASGKALRIAAGLGRRLVTRLLSLRPTPQTRSARAMMADIAARGVSTELVYCEDDPGLADLSLHFGTDGKRLTALPGVTLTMIGAYDHDLTPPEAQAALRSRILEVMRAAG